MAKDISGDASIADLRRQYNEARLELISLYFQASVGVEVGIYSHQEEIAALSFRVKSLKSILEDVGVSVSCHCASVLSGSLINGEAMTGSGLDTPA